MGRKGSYLLNEISKPVPESEPLDARQVKNHAGGYVFATGHWMHLRRFLILGTEGGTYYADQRQHTKESLNAVKACLLEDGMRLVNEIVQISQDGRAPKNDPALLALAYAASEGSDDVKRYALANLHKVARTGTHLFHFIAFARQYRGWGRALKNAVRDWYLAKPVDKLALQVVKYQQRDGWSHRDLLRLTHPKTDDAMRRAVFEFALKKEDFTKGPDMIEGARVMQAITGATKADVKTAVQLITDFNLPREIIPTQLLNAPEVWEALLSTGGITMVIRNLATMTRVGLLKPLSQAEKDIVKLLGNQDAIIKGRVHPIQILAANLTYAAGRGARDMSKTWTPSQKVVKALDEAFYLAFKAVEPTGKNFFLGVDVSGSMAGGSIAGVPGLTPCIGAAAMALVIANTESNYFIGGFAHHFKDLRIHPGMSLRDAARAAQDANFGGTDGAVAMKYAMQHSLDVDCFVIITDNEVWAGNTHASTALRQFRTRMNKKDCKMVTVGMTATNFTIADPNDPGQLDVVGFDTATPQLISEFAKGL